PDPALARGGSAAHPRGGRRRTSLAGVSLKRETSSLMNMSFCDASTLGKRYTTEVGSEAMNQFFASVSHDRLVVLTKALDETLSILVRQPTAGTLSHPTYQRASQALRSELILAAQVQLRVTDDEPVFASLPLMEQH